MGGKHSRTKGHTFEREVAKVMRVSFPDAERGLQYRDPSSCDVEGTPFRIECKRQKVITAGDVKRAINQCHGDAYEWEDERPCIVITREDRGEPYVHMKLGTLLMVVERLFWREPDNVVKFPDDWKEL